MGAPLDRHAVIVATCRTCRREFERNPGGRGRPRLDCTECRPPAREKGPTERGVERDLRPTPAAIRTCAEAEAARALARAIDSGLPGLAGNVRELRAVMTGLRTRASMMVPDRPAAPAEPTTKGGPVASITDRIRDKRAAAGGAPPAR